MTTKGRGRVRGLSCAALGCSWLGLAQVTAGAQETRLASIAPYLMDREEEIDQDLGTGFGHWRPHVMIYLADLDNAAWGIPGFTNEFPFVAEAGTPWSVAVVPMQMFSDGTSPRAATGGGKGG